MLLLALVLCGTVVMSGCGPSPIAKARQLIEIGMIDDAETALKEQVQKNPLDAEAFLWLGNVSLIRLQRVSGGQDRADAAALAENAFRNYAAVIKLKPDDSRAFGNMALLCSAGALPEQLRPEMVEVIKGRLKSGSEIGAIALLLAPYANELGDTLLALSDAWSAEWKPSKWVRPTAIQRAVDGGQPKTAYVIDPGGVNWPSYEAVRWSSDPVVEPYVQAGLQPHRQAAGAFAVIRVVGDSVSLLTEQRGGGNGFISKSFVRGSYYGTQTVETTPDMGVFQDRDLTAQIMLPPGAHVSSATLIEDLLWVPMIRPGIMAQYVFSVPDSCRAALSSVAIRPDALGQPVFDMVRGRVQRQIDRARRTGIEGAESTAVKRATRWLSRDTLRRLISGEIAIGAPLELALVSLGAVRMDFGSIRFGKNGAVQSEIKCLLPDGTVTCVLVGGRLVEVREEASLTSAPVSAITRQKRDLPRAAPQAPKVAAAGVGAAASPPPALVCTPAHSSSESMQIRMFGSVLTGPVYMTGSAL